MKRLKPSTGIDISEDGTLSENSPDKVLSQQAVRSFTIPKVIKTTDPTTSDVDYDVPTIWLNSITNIGYILTDITLNVATWKNFTSIPGLIFKGTISVKTDFPNLADVQEGWLYIITANVTDNAGAPHTNTGDSFISGTEISWNGTGWSNLGAIAIWQEIAGVISPVNNNTSSVQIRSLSITTLISNTLKILSGAGNLHQIVISGITNASVVTLYDNITAGGTIIWSSGAMSNQTVPFSIDMKGLPFYTGLTLVIATQNSNALVIYE